MNLSVLIGQLYMVAFLGIGLGMLLSPAYYQKAYLAMMKDITLYFVWGVFALIVGFLIITRHNVWQGWPTLLTIFGWIGFLKGVSLLVIPGLLPKISNFWFKSKTFIRVWGGFAIFLGLLLGYFIYYT
jgi:hypothetical protein